LIIIETIEFANFLSTGNIPNFLDFRKYKNTLIVGKNGDGKTTIIDALCFALYGKSFRDINKPQLLNSRTQKGLLVKVVLQANGSRYEIRRGIKPNVFEIIKNGLLVDQTPDPKDYQAILEKTILKMDYRTFTQIVVLGSANYTPFMKLPLAGRRALVEDLLDIGIFSIMNVVLKEQVQNNKKLLSDNERTIDLIEGKIELNNKHLKQLQQNNDEIIEAKQSRIKELEAKNLEIEDWLLCNVPKIHALQKEIEHLTEASLKHSEMKQLDQVVSQKLVKLNKQVEFYQSNTSCHTCLQEISPSFKEAELTNLGNQIKEVEDGQKKLTAKISKLYDKVKDIASLNSTLMQLNRKVSSEQSLQLSYIRAISELQSEIKGLQTKNKKVTADDSINDELKVALADQIEIKKQLFQEREVLNIATVLLKDGGIKSNIIGQYIPIINKLINKYLEALDYFINFEFDDNFNERINVRYKSDFSYSSFSEGQKARINLAILFAWRDVAKLRNSAATNILFFDEIFDGPLDGEGTENFISMINTMTPETNVLMISHKRDALLDKFDHTIKVKMVNNFSMMEDMQ